MHHFARCVAGRLRCILGEWLSNTKMRTQAPIVLLDRSPLGGVTILFVDHSQDERELFAERFGTACARLTTVSSVDEALAVLDRGETELVVTEVRLPGSDGYDLLRRMRERPVNTSGGIPAIAVTTNDASGNGDRLLAAGFAAIVQKPYEASDLMGAVADASAQIAALRHRRASDLDAPTEQSELRSRLGTRSRAPGANATRRPAQFDEEAAAQVIATAARFAELELASAVDDITIGSCQMIDKERESWVVYARSTHKLLFVEVIVGPGKRPFARRLDLGVGPRSRTRD